MGGVQQEDIVAKGDTVRQRDSKINLKPSRKQSHSLPPKRYSSRTSYTKKITQVTTGQAIHLPSPSSPCHFHLAHFDPSAAVEVTNVRCFVNLFRGVLIKMSRYFYNTLHWFFSVPFSSSCSLSLSLPLPPFHHDNALLWQQSEFQIGNCKVINYIAHRVIVSLPRLYSPQGSQITF